jgi:hypothetical protein
MFPESASLHIHSGALLQGDDRVIHDVIDQLVFYCHVQGLKTRPVMARENKGCIDIVWSMEPPSQLTEGRIIQVVSHSDVTYYDNWSITSSISLKEYRKGNPTGGFEGTWQITREVPFDQFVQECWSEGMEETVQAE